MEDISPILEGWPHDQSNCVRRIRGADGRERIQIRVCINTYHGILQFDCDGRPDGARPHGREFALDYYEERLSRGRDSGGESAFRLTREECQELFDESSMTYQRYIVLLQVGDFDRVIRDTSRNMRIFQFVHRHADLIEDRTHLEKWWPYILRIHYTARAMKKAAEADYREAVSEVEACRGKIEGLAEQDDDTFRLEKKRSLDALKEMEAAFLSKVPEEKEDDELKRLEREKAEAVRRQDYERAADLRDRINRMIAERAKESGEGGGAGPIAGRET